MCGVQIGGDGRRRPGQFDGLKASTTCKNARILKAAPQVFYDPQRANAVQLQQGSIQTYDQSNLSKPWHWHSARAVGVSGAVGWWKGRWAIPRDLNGL